jgi:putative phosphonate metabolism protein
MKPRYAVYFAPTYGSPWWTFGAGWLGRDERDNTELVQPTLMNVASEELRKITTAPRRYGFHATLKAPFSLSGEHTAADLTTRLEILAATLKPVPLGPLQATIFGGFVALMPKLVTNELMALAAACVTELDDLRAPLSDAELARRQMSLLQAREQALLQAYGYPYVLERFRFHLTLSEPMPLLAAQRVQQALTASVAQLNAAAPLVLDRLCLFVEPGPGQPFKRIADAALRA